LALVEATNWLLASRCAWRKFPPSDFQKFPLGTETISGTVRHRQLAVGGDVIKHLREKPADIGWSFAEVKNARLLSSTSEKACFTKALAVVERAGHFKRGDVFRRAS